MAEFITKIRTESGDLQIDYNALANLPQSDKTLSKDGKFADAKATGDAIKNAAAVDKTLSVEGKAADANTTGLKFKDIEEALETAQTNITNAQGTADAALPKAGGQMTGDVDMGDKKITNLQTPTDSGDAVNKNYVDEKYFYSNVTLMASAWSGDIAPHTQEVTLTGILSTDNPHYSVVYSGDAANKINQKEAFSAIDDLETIDGKLIFTCFEDKPQMDLNIHLEVNR